MRTESATAFGVSAERENTGGGTGLNPSATTADIFRMVPGAAAVFGSGCSGAPPAIAPHYTGAGSAGVSTSSGSGGLGGWGAGFAFIFPEARWMAS